MCLIENYTWRLKNIGAGQWINFKPRNFVLRLTVCKLTITRFRNTSGTVRDRLGDLSIQINKRVWLRIRYSRKTLSTRQATVQHHPLTDDIDIDLRLRACRQQINKIIAMEFRRRANSNLMASEGRAIKTTAWELNVAECVYSMLHASYVNQRRTVVVVLRPLV